jgi:hypothetical protein
MSIVINTFMDYTSSNPQLLVEHFVEKEYRKNTPLIGLKIFQINQAMKMMDTIHGIEEYSLWYFSEHPSIHLGYNGSISLVPKPTVGDYSCHIP